MLHITEWLYMVIQTQDKNHNYVYVINDCNYDVKAVVYPACTGLVICLFSLFRTCVQGKCRTTDSVFGRKWMS